MNKTFLLQTPNSFSFEQTLLSHGWSSLAPFEYDRENFVLKTVLKAENPVSIEIRKSSSKNFLEIKTDKITKKESLKILRDVQHILRVDDDLSEFYKAANRDKNFAWITRKKAGRLLRSPTVFEDLVKTICTTNCSWSLTKIMVSNLVEKLGETTESGEKSFPTPEKIAEKDEEFFRKEIRAGYRAPYFPEIAQKIVEGRLDVENWLNKDLPTAELKKEIKKVKGVGDYAAENLLKLLGHYDGLALDSMLRARFYNKHNNGLICPDKEINAFYEKFGKWRGLAIWFDLTEK